VRRSTPYRAVAHAIGAKQTQRTSQLTPAHGV
jgi:hypothetical protein